MATPMPQLQTGMGAVKHQEFIRQPEKDTQDVLSDINTNKSLVNSHGWQDRA